MEWKIAWRDLENAYPLHRKQLTSEDELEKLVIELIGSQARDISISRTPPGRDMGGVPYDDIATSFKNKTTVPFLGAGVPLSGRPSGAKWQYDSDFLPSAAELGDYIGDVADLPAWLVRDTENLARVASYYTKTNADTLLANRLREIFARGNPTAVHEFLARSELHPMVIVTTNYDTLMEDALGRNGVKFDTVIHCTNIAEQGRVIFRKDNSKPELVHPDSVEIREEVAVLLYKMHGSIERQGPADTSPKSTPQESYVITEEDYVKFLSRLNAAPPVIPVKLDQHFRNSRFLFLGYSFEDWNVRVILDSLTELMTDPGTERATAPESQTEPKSGVPTKPPPTLAQYLGVPPPGVKASDGRGHKSRTHWAIQLNPTPYDIAVWQGRHVEIRDVELNKFVKKLESPPYGLFLKKPHALSV
ncbi:MAG: hypothetical protein C5B58_02905 [Acidobacteria bacterium]|nr:MAG: hypothetical protein C5B58_02905 [Acidobacteriota bacterium]